MSPIGNPWHVIGCSVTGESHQRDGRACEDRHAIKVLSPEILMIAVADGAGTARHGACGAARAVEACLATLEALAGHDWAAGDEQWWTDRLRAELDQIHALLTPDDAAADAADYAATLIGVGVFRGGVVAVQVGDGAAVVETVDGRIEGLTRPEHGEYLNETTFITSKDACARAQIVVRPGAAERIKSVAVFSDGIEPLAWDWADNRPHAPFFGPLFRFAASEEADASALSDFLQSERVCLRTDDDKTLVLATR